MNGVLYYNRGDKCLVRLAVALHSLRKHWRGECAVVGDQGDYHADAMRIICGRYDCKLVESSFATTDGAKVAYLNKCLLDSVTPFEKTLYIDADTVVVGELNSAFAYLSRAPFAITQFSDWRSDKPPIAGRIEAWRQLYQEWIDAALAYGPAINFGVFAWERGASTLMKSLWGLASPGREFCFIPDEVCCQVLLPRNEHCIIPQEYNCSCKYSNPRLEGVRIVHFHGNKHCRLSKRGRPAFNSDIWYREFEEIRGWVKPEWIEADKQLVEALPCLQS